MDSSNNVDRRKMVRTYAENQISYKRWARERKHYNSGYNSRALCLTSASRKKLLTVSKKLLEEFPQVSFIEAHERIGGNQELLWSLGLWKSAHDPYWDENQEKWRIYVRLRLFPEEIEHALLRTDLWAQKLMVPTEAVEAHIPEILKDIADGVVW